MHVLNQHIFSFGDVKVYILNRFQTYSQHLYKVTTNFLLGHNSYKKTALKFIQ